MSRTTILFLPVLTCAMLALGCETPVSATSGDVDSTRLKLVGILYGRCIRANGGRPPKDEQQFLRYLESKPKSWEKLVSRADELLSSPYDGEPLVILYGKQFQQQHNERNPLVGHERTGVGGLLRVISVRGSVKEMDSKQIEDVFKG